MKVIGVFGRKGGSGKTLVSHFVSHGMAALGHTTIMLQTDVRETRPPEIIDKRNYMLASTRGDGTDLSLIMQIFDKISKIPNAVLVMDGGANRRNIDVALAQLADIVLLPTGYGHEDIAVAESDHKDLTNILRQKRSKAEAYIVMNRWPGVRAKLDMIHQKSWIKDFTFRAELMGHVFPYFVPDMPSLIDMAHGEDPRYTLLIDSRAKSFAKLVGRKIDLISGDTGDGSGGGGGGDDMRDDMSFYTKKDDEAA